MVMVYSIGIMECFCDVDYVGSKATMRSTTGYCVFVGGNLVSWKSKKQDVVSSSNVEAKYRAMAQAITGAQMDGTM